MAAIFSGFESHRAYVGRGGKKNEKREAEERNRTETIFTSGLARYRHRCHKEVGRFRAKSIEWSHSDEWISN